MLIAGTLSAATLVAALAVAPATMPGSSDARQDDEIVVTGSWKPKLLNAKELARAVQAHGKLRGAYAPHSRLLFQVTRGPGGKDLDGLTLTFHSEEGNVPVLLDTDHRFRLPELPRKGWKLVSNRSNGSFGIMPLVMSPGSSLDDRLFGDLRLQCEVLWEMGKPDLSILMRVTANAFGGFCKGSVLPFFVWSDRPIRSAWVSNQGLTMPVYISEDRHAYRPPLHDKTLPHAARVRLRHE